MKASSDPKDSAVVQALEREDVLKFLEQEIHSAGEKDDVEYAYEFLDVYRQFRKKVPNFSKIHPDLFERYTVLVVQAQWIALYYISEADLVNVCKNHLLEGIRSLEYFEQDTIRKLNLLLLNFPRYESREQLKFRLRSALLENEERISEDFSVGGNSMPGTIQNWLKIYVQKVGAFPEDSLKRSEFFAGGYFQKQSSEIQKQLRILFTIFDYVSFPSLHVKGLEDVPLMETPEGEMIVLHHGELDRVKSIKTPSGKSFAEVIYGSGAESGTEESSVRTGKVAQNQKVGEPGSARNVSLPQDSSRLITVLFPPKGIPKATEIKEVLEQMAEQGVLLSTLATNERLQSFGQSALKAIGVEEGLFDIRNPMHVQTFLRGALQGRGKLDEHHAAAVGLHIATLLEQKGIKGYTQIAEYDSESGQFYWNPLHS